MPDHQGAHVPRADLVTPRLHYVRRSVARAQHILNGCLDCHSFSFQVK
jgi:hypothetical protein